MKKYIMSISLLLIIILILWIGPLNILKSLEDVNWILILLALLIHILVLFLRGFRWGFIIKKPWDFKDNFVVKTIGLFAGNFSPVRTAGEPVTAIAGKKINGISISEGLSAGLTERFFDLMIVGLLLVFACLFVPKVRILAIIGAIFSLGIVFIIYLINWRKNSSLWIYKKIHPLLKRLPISPEYLEEVYSQVIYGLKGMVEYTQSFTSVSNLGIVFIISSFCWLLECIRLLTVFYAFNIKIELIAVVIIFLLANIIGVISALPGGMGSIEISLTGLFVIFGVPKAISGSIVLIDRLISFWVVTALGLIFTSFYVPDLWDDLKTYTTRIKKPKS
ncbi:MAG: hypothetical protein CVV28_06275 [Methanobacteriales archaeon HGW-Methanobacteriales-1]|nr:MAG: hypothetical protein CVV28_06275 [Methanobacteriales archaeon HGW-Methanobacteriales-1]